MLRQDPDIILVGEIRDKETAEIAVQASLTGHLVFSTLHTNDAPSAIARLLDLGLEPFLVTATLEGIVAQRLVPTRSATTARASTRPPKSSSWSWSFARRRAGQEVLLRQGLRELQQHRLQRPSASTRSCCSTTTCAT